MKYVGRIFSRGSLDYCSAIFDNRLEAASACFAARPEATTCITSEARYNEDLKAVVPTHYGVQNHHRGPASSQAAPPSLLSWLQLAPRIIPA
jgi:hypothetical protein